MRCWICGSDDPNDFTLYRTDRICDDCMSILNYWYKETFYDIKTRYKALNGAEMGENEFLEGLSEYVEIMTDDYNRNLIKERRINAIGEQTGREKW